MKNLIKSLLLIPLLFLTRSHAQPLVESKQSTMTNAEQSETNAQFCLRVLYNNSRSMIQNDREAVKWYRKAAEQGDTFAQFCLGFLYGNGRGVTQNDKEAYAWFSVVAAQGNNDGARYRDLTAEKLPLPSLSEAQDLADDYNERYSK